MKYFMGIDLGTSGVKVVILDMAGNIVSIGSKEQSMATPQPGWAEQEPEVWWQTTCCAVADAVKKAGAASRDIAGIGLSGQMLGATMLDKSLSPVRSCIIWCDQRSFVERDWFEQKFGLNTILEETANYPLTGYWAPKLLWMKKQEPALYDRIHKVIFPKDYIRLKLTGELKTEVSDAGGSALFDVAKRAWNYKLIDALEIPRSFFVDVVESEEITGYLKKDIAELLGLPENIPVVGGGGDQTAGGVGNGIVKEGLVSSTIGTSGVVFACADSVKIDYKSRGLHAFCHSVRNKWSVFGCTLAAGGSFKWLRDNILTEERNTAKDLNIDPYDLITLEASKAKPGSEGLLFLPYLIGERTPYPDPYAKGVFMGLTLRHSRQELIRSVMEGVTFSLRDTVEILREFNINVSEVRASGGGAKSSLWLQIQADIFNTEVITTNVDEGPATGAAILAGVGAGAFESVEAACSQIIKPLSSTKPNRENVKVYDELYSIYRSLYPALKDIYREHSRICF